MNLRTALKANGYTINDLWYHMKNRGYDIDRAELTKISGARCPGNASYWNIVLDCLDDMGVDW